MREIAVEEAKQCLPELLDEVERGEPVIITRGGKPVATLTATPRVRPPVSETIKELLAFRDAHPLDGITIRELIDEGRRI